MPCNFIKRPAIVPVGPSIAYLPLTRGLYAIVDRGELDKVGQSNWFASPSKKDGEFVARRVVSKKRLQSLNACLLGLTDNVFTADHVVPGNSLNCLPHNLRVATPSQQSANQRRRSSNTSGYKGVYWVKAKSKWHASISCGGKVRHLGTFEAPSEAHQAYVRAARDLMGEFARAA